ncbi:phage tail tube protein [Roseomonas sp. HJA6]|uniref:Phage tail tube protein n=1 Tax=Roseomonas alba TaxID=2846776 RepID=A0ABS7ACU0_9PROT|nr:phage tail tube protein [Neoroseomonas alba]MBW6399983.1 phage tail tube protein [Neoroseomonas alba]
MALKRIAGTAYIKVDSVQLALKGSIEVDPADVMREPVTGLDGVHGYKETPKAPSITVTVSKTPDLKLKQVLGWKGRTVTAELGDGTTYVLSDAFQSGELKLDGAEGQVPITFTGASCREMN